MHIESTANVRYRTNECSRVFVRSEGLYMGDDKLVLCVIADDNHGAGLSSSTPVNTGDYVLSSVPRYVSDALCHRLISTACFQFSARHHVVAKGRRQSKALVFKLR